MVTTFQWSSDFETGLDVVDKQHHNLVNIINRYGEHVAKGNLTPKMLPPVLEELLDYTRYHFNEEENLMESNNLDQRHIDGHKKEHSDFIYEVKNLHSGMSFDRSDDIQHLLSFLIHWLAFHILGKDQNMARQIESRNKGIDASEAYVQQEVESNKSTEPLLVALRNLFSLVTSRNRDLARLNESLEQKVQERTQKLLTANYDLEQLALTDVLTGLHNRRYALQALDSLWEEHSGNWQNLSCMMIDVDNFKTVNDTFGHDAGDEVLIKLTETLQDNLRTDDILSRMGGDEFIVLCPGTDIAGITLVAENLLKQVNCLSVNVGGGTWNGRISIGIAVRSPEMPKWNDLLKSADNAVYSAKDSGRNCIRTDPEISGDGQV